MNNKTVTATLHTQSNNNKLTVNIKRAILCTLKPLI